MPGDRTAAVGGCGGLMKHRLVIRRVAALMPSAVIGVPALTIGPQSAPRQPQGSESRRLTLLRWQRQPRPRGSFRRCCSRPATGRDTNPSPVCPAEVHRALPSARTPEQPTGYQWCSSTFSAVTCTWAAACTLVGEWNDSSSGWPLAERWNGTSWTVQAPAIPAGATDAGFAMVSCPKSTGGFDCEALGGYSTSNGSHELAERWDGINWTIQSIAEPAGSAVNGLSCASPTVCFAVGEEQSTPTSLPQPLIEQWNGTTWSIQPSAILKSGDLLSVSCVSASVCTAVGTTYSAFPHRPGGRANLRTVERHELVVEAHPSRFHLQRRAIRIGCVL
jgi:hypothetical protein